jgi:hypothetical protein
MLLQAPQPGVDAGTVRAFIEGSIGILVVYSVWTTQQRNGDMKETIKGLTTATGKLNETMTSIDKNTALHGQRLDQHDKELSGLWENVCHNAECPLRAGRHFELVQDSPEPAGIVERRSIPR